MVSKESGIHIIDTADLLTVDSEQAKQVKYCELNLFGLNGLIIFECR